MLKQIYRYLSTPEKKGNKIGLFRIITAIFGGLLMSYLGMTLLAFLLPFNTAYSAVIAIMFNTFAWAIVATYISLSYTKLQTLLRFVIPSGIFSLMLLIFT